MQRVNKKPVDHFEGKWHKDRKYTLFAVVENNGTLFRSLTAKPKQEPYVIYNAENETFVANDGWELVRLSKDSEISSGGNLTLEDLATALEKVVSVESQSLTDEQKAQARTNIGAVSDVDLSNALDKLAVLEDILGITLDPDLDEKYYKYFTIEATQDGTTIYFRQSSYAVDGGLDPLKVEVSTDNGETWTEVTAAPAEDDVPGATLAELDEGEKVLIRGRNEAYGYYSEDEGLEIENCNLWADKPCYVCGNIMSLVGGDNFARLRKVKEYAFAHFFHDYDEALDWSWVLSKEGEELLLPATTLAEKCYSRMFYSCVGLTSAPVLPAMNLASMCYEGMFYGCTSLTSVLELPATTLVYGCYNSMFSGCTNLTTAPKLPATILAENCYSFMFNHCSSLTVAPELPATTLAKSCYTDMFSTCTSLAVAPELPATMLVDSCYAYMFYKCTSLTTAPVLPATLLVDNCYYRMFSDCTNLSYIKAMFTTTPGNSYTQSWVSGVKPTGTFVKNSAATWDVTGNNGVPTGWTVETANA